MENQEQIKTDQELLSDKISRLRNALKAIEITLRQSSDPRSKEIDWTEVNDAFNDLEIKAEAK
ncbi:MAG: hypothetical protein Q8R55_05320 [Candidatus Taylorbacteria bacterium]|nr:hypothetical protein [Candidatus Taylorbacteria bacterium]